MDELKQLHSQQHKEISRSDEIHFSDSLVLIRFNPREVRLNGTSQNLENSEKLKILLQVKRSFGSRL